MTLGFYFQVLLESPFFFFFFSDLLTIEEVPCGMMTEFLPVLMGHLDSHVSMKGVIS